MSKRELSNLAKELIAARRRIENPDNWIQGTLERHGRVCAIGALSQTAETITYHACLGLLLKASSKRFGTNPVYVNDCLGHHAVMEMYDMAIAMEIQRANT